MLGNDDRDQSPAPLQKPELETKASLPRQARRRRDFEPAEAILGIRKNLPNGPDRVRRYAHVPGGAGSTGVGQPALSSSDTASAEMSLSTTGLAMAAAAMFRRSGPIWIRARRR